MIMPATIDKELEWWNEDTKRLNRMADKAKKLGIVVPVLGGTTDNHGKHNQLDHGRGGGGGSITREQVVKAMAVDSNRQGMSMDDAILFHNKRAGRIFTKIEKGGWTSSSDLTVRDRKGGRDVADTSKTLKSMKSKGFVDVAWDQSGTPHYNVKGSEITSWLTQSDNDADLAKLPNKPTTNDYLALHHQPGKHIQKSHSGSKGVAGGAVGEDVAFPPANPDGNTTKQQHKNEDGTWTKERTELHQEIIDDHFAGKTPVDEPTAYMMGGGTASGKSGMEKELSIPENTVKINADDIKKKLPEYNQRMAADDPSAAAFVHHESSDVSRRIQGEGSAGGYNTLLDGTGDGGIDELTKDVGAMRSSGQKVVANYVTVSTDEAVRRSNERAKTTKRYVPETFIRENHATISRTIPQAIERDLFDGFTLWDNNVALGKPVIRVADKVRGGALQIHEQTLWDNFVAKGEG